MPHADRPATPPGIAEPQRFMPRFHYELLVCGLRGHELIGTDAEQIRGQDAVVMRQSPDGWRWYRCLRCDSWLPLPPPGRPQRRYPPDPEAIDVPLRGKALRDKIVLRLIAIDRAIHFVILAALAAAIFVFAANRDQLRAPVYKALADLQSGFGGHDSGHGVAHDLRRLFSVQSGTLTKIGLLVAAYAVLEGAEAVGLWFQKRWAEYLTFIATSAFLPLEVYEIFHRISPLKIVTFVVNVAIVAYLLIAKRLFGIRGGATAEEAERERDAGWEALVRTAPPAGAMPTAPVG